MRPSYGLADCVRIDRKRPVIGGTGFRQRCFVALSLRARATLPDTIAVGGQHDVTDALTLAAEATWTNWARFGELRVKFGSAQPDLAADTDWEASWRVALGSIYQVSDEVTVRGGIALEETPIKNATHRIPRIPDDDRLWLGAGFDYELDDSLSLGISYAHLFVQDADVNVTSSTGQTLVGDYDNSVDIVSMQVVYSP